MKIKDSSGSTYHVEIPEGYSGEYYMVCPICTPKRKPEHQKLKALSFNMDKKDLPWRCKHCGEKGYAFTEEDIIHRKIKPILNIPQNRPVEEPHYQWMLSRGLKKETVDHFKIKISNESVMQNKHEDPEKRGKWANVICLNFPYFADGLLINIKYRDKRKNFKLIAGAIKIFYNIDSIQDRNYCIITEGEFDAMAYHQTGLTSVVSVPNGATISDKEKDHFNETGQLKVFNPLNLEYLDLNIEMFDHIKTIYIATDDDPTGIKLRMELARRLGKERCKYIRFGDYKDKNDNPINDPNQLLIEKGEKVLADTINKAYDFPMDNVSTADDYIDEILSDYDHGREKGKSSGYESLDPYFSWVNGWLYMLNGYPNEGKAESIYTDIPTPNGFVKMGDIKSGDLVYDETGNPCRVTFATEIMYDHPCYEIIFCDNTKTICDENHLWKVYSREARASRNRHIRKEPRTANTKGIDQQHLMVQPKIVNTKYIFENQKSSDSNKNNFSVDNALPINNPKANLPLHPYVLGIWLGDGDTGGNGITMSDPDAIEVFKFISDLNYEVRKLKVKYRWSLIGIYDVMKKLNLRGNKHIPEEYFTASIEQRLELLQGIMDTDGTIHEDGKCELSLSDKKLARDAHTLISGLGIKVSFYCNKSFLNGKNKKDRYRMRFITDLPVFKLKRKLEYIRKDLHIRHTYRTIFSVKKVDSVPVRCIQVDSENRLYLTTRSYIPTHNSSVMFNLMVISSVLYGDKWGVYSPENYPPKNIVDTFAEILLNNTSNPEIESRIKKYEYKDVIIQHISKHFYFVNNEDGYSPAELLKVKETLVRQKGITGFFTDPWSALNHKDMGQREDHYIAQTLNHEIRLAKKYNLINVISHHPPKPADIKGTLKAPHPYQLSGGSMWWNKSDVIFCAHRVNRVDYTDNKLGFHVQKVKEIKIFGDKTNVDEPVVLQYSPRTNRLFERQVITDPNSAYNKYPFKKWESKENLTFDGF
jgi:hypothetical protein